MKENELVIRFDNVSKVYNLYKNEKEQFISLFGKRNTIKKKSALRNVNLEIYKSEAVAFIGKNGAGKSTLLKMVTGVTFPTEGIVTVNGRIGALLELTSGFLYDMSGRENIYLRGMILGLSRQEIREIEPMIIEFAELDDYIDQPIRTYSTGMRARLGFSINSSIQPDILVVDEALSVGDLGFKEKCVKRIRDMIDKKTTVLYVTHSLGSIKEVCSRVIYLKNGSIIFDGDIDTGLNIYINQTQNDDKTV